MANESLKTVGARVVVEGAEQAEQSWNKVTEAQFRNAESAEELNKIYGWGMKAQDEYFARQAENAQIIEETTRKVSLLGNEWRRAFESFKSVGETPQRALNEIRRATEEGINPTVLLRDNQDLLFEHMQRLAAEGKTWNEIQKEMNELAGKNATAHGNLSEKAIHSSRAFFALTLASFGVMSVAQELKKSFGDDLPPAFEKTSSAIQQIASFGSAGAFLGGAPGAIFGGIAGGLVAITTAAVTLDPELQRLNQQLDNMSNRDELIQSLAEIAGVSDEVAKSWIDIARKDPSFASVLEDTTKKAEKVPGILATMSSISKELTGTFDGLAESVGGLGDALNKQLLNEAAKQAGGLVFIKAMLEGKNTSEAFVIAEKARLQIIEDTNKATKEGTEFNKELIEEQLRLAEAGQRAKDSTDSLLQSLGKLGAGDARTQLSALVGISEELSKGFLDYANQNREVAKEAEVLTGKIQEQEIELAKLQESFNGKAIDPIIQHIIDRLTKSIHDQKEALKDLVLGHQLAKDSTEELSKAQAKLADALENANHRMSLLAEKTANQYAQAQQQYSNAVQDAAEQRANAIFNAEQTLTNRISDLWQDLQNKVADINQTLADKISDIQVQLQNRIADIQSQLSDRIADIQQQLADKVRDINQDLQNKLQDLAHSRDQAVQGANQKILDASRELSRKLYEIERDRLEAIEALAFSTHEQLQDARTDHDRDRILRRAQFEQGQIDQKANDARKDAIADYQDKVAQAEREKKLAKDTYDYQVMLAKQLAAQKIANAQHDADVQIAQAQRQAQQQLAIAQRQAQQQLDIAQREAAQQLALAQRRHEQELATAQRSYQQQVEAARRAEQQRVSDAQRALEQRNAAIARSHDAERKQIEYTLQKAIEAYQRQIAEIKNLALAVQALIQQYMILAGIAENIAKLGSAATTGLFGDWINNIHDVVKEGTVPTPPLTPLLGGTREGNLITPASINTSTRNNSINIVINDATDARKVGEVVRRELAQVAWR